jgi:uncharacterized protein YndB with AHSA1/START domain
MTIATELETPIGRSAEAVFAELVAVERYPDWLVASGIVRVDRLDSGPVQDGSRIRVEQRIAGRAATLDGVVTVFEPPRRFAFEVRDRDGIKLEADAQLAPDGPMSRLRWSLRISLPLRYRFFEGMAAPQVRQAAISDLDNLRRRLESVAG